MLTIRPIIHYVSLWHFLDYNVGVMWSTLTLSNKTKLWLGGLHRSKNVGPNPKKHNCRTRNWPGLSIIWKLEPVVMQNREMPDQTQSKDWIDQSHFMLIYKLSNFGLPNVGSVLSCASLLCIQSIFLESSLNIYRFLLFSSSWWKPHV